RIQEHGAELVNGGDVRLEPAPVDGVFPEQFHVTSNHPMEVRLNGRWHPVTPTRMDCGITVDPVSGEARAVRFPMVKQGDRVVVGHYGVRVLPVQRNVRRADAFEFMGSEVSAEKPKALAIRAI